MSKDRTIDELVQVFHNGEKMTDYELSIFHRHCEETASNLTELGPEYRILANSAREIARVTHDYMVARGMKADNPVVARPVSLKQLIEADVFIRSDEKEESGDVAEGYVVRDNYDEKLESYSREPSGGYALGYDSCSCSIDPYEKCFVVLKVNVDI